MSRSPVRTLVVDGSSAFSDGVRKWICEHPDLLWVGTVATGPEALEAASALAPDLVLLDVASPGPGGLELIRELKACAPESRIVILSFHETGAARDAALSAGADGFLSKGTFADGLSAFLPTLRAPRVPGAGEPGIGPG